MSFGCHLSNLQSALVNLGRILLEHVSDIANVLFAVEFVPVLSHLLNNSKDVCRVLCVLEPRDRLHADLFGDAILTHEIHDKLLGFTLRLDLCAEFLLLAFHLLTQNITLHAPRDALFEYLTLKFTDLRLSLLFQIYLLPL